MLIWCTALTIGALPNAHSVSTEWLDGCVRIPRQVTEVVENPVTYLAYGDSGEGETVSSGI